MVRNTPFESLYRWRKWPVLWERNMSEPSITHPNRTTSFPSHNLQVINYTSHQLEEILMTFYTRCHHICLNRTVIFVILLQLKCDNKINIAQQSGLRINIKTATAGIEIHIIKINPSHDLLVFIMGIPILVGWNRDIAATPLNTSSQGSVPTKNCRNCWT